MTAKKRQRLSIRDINIESVFAYCFAAFLLIGCEVNGSKREVKTQDSIVISMVNTFQFATNSSEYQRIFPYTQSFSAAADSGSSMGLQVSPGFGCYQTKLLEEVSQQQMLIQRFFDVGSVKIKDSENETTTLTKSEGNIYYTFMPLPSGRTTISSDGVRNGSLKMSNNFTVLSREADIAVVEVNTNNEAINTYPMVSPEIPDEEDRIVFHRDGINAVVYNAPEGTDFVKVTLSDGRGREEIDARLTCIFPPEETNWINSKLLRRMRSTDEASLKVEFIRVQEIRDVARLKVGHIVSSMAHIQGSIVYSDGEETTTDRFGVVEIR